MSAMDTIMQSHLYHFVAAYWPYFVVGLTCLSLARNYFNRGLNRYPGPFLANFTDAWRLWDVSKDHHQHTMIALHEKYGPVVRTGPNTVDISDSDYVPEIYGIKKGFNKTAYYHPFVNINNGKIVDSMFSTRDERAHTEMKRPVAGIYSLSGLQDYEPLVDEMIRILVDRLKVNFDGAQTKGKACDLSAWMHYYAFDVIFNITFGNTGGFMVRGEDTDGFIAELDRNQNTNALLTQMPWLTYLHRRNPLRIWLNVNNTFFPAFVRQQISEHMAKVQSEDKTSGSDEKPGRVDDMLSRFMRLQGARREWVAMYALQNVFAGSDTTAITLRAIMYFLLRDPERMQKLMTELRSADPPLSYPVTWKESQRLPYLHAVVEESLRLFPAVGMSLEREVPSSGLEMSDGFVLSPGTAVGMNPWVVNRQSAVFGPLPTDQFRPERWMQAANESKEDFEARLSGMRRVFMSFGWGKRICLGRNISYLEIYKAIPTLLLEFEIGLVDPTKEWDTFDRFFVHQRGMDVWLRSRSINT